MKTLTKHVSYECKCRFDGRNVIQVKGGITIYVDMSVKKVMYVKKVMFGIFLHIITKMGNIYQVLWKVQRLCQMKL